MHKAVLPLLLIFVMAYSADSVFAEQARLATYHEVAQVIVDQKISNNVTASISLQTTSIQEFQIPHELDAKIRNSTDIVGIIITNENQCILGIHDQICVMINTKRESGQGGIIEAQDKAREIGDRYIDDINSAFSLNTKFHSVFIHYDDSSNEALETSGQVSGAGTVSTVYTAQVQSTDYMFNKISATLMPAQIRSMGGFFEVAQKLAKDDNSRMTFTILPREHDYVMQLKVSEKYPNTAKDTKVIDTLKLFKVDEIRKSNYFAGGFFPLNSLIHVVILPIGNDVRIHTNTNVIDAIEKNNQTIPADITESGWFFNSKSESKIEVMYLFGEEFSAKRQDLIMTLGEKESTPEKMDVPGANEMYILIGIGIVASGAAVYYLKGFKTKKNTT
ncbi:hypothetical protein [Candidatus Nitrosotenuis sp. DW1]|uniref:hypothetical protein n=1 Tax=Candidatus Nitrosotenuis sp. DW1 TaxID=2259672 RepID=UPI0015C71275|nr:hypothetical protein [Candidatus Nitrosotenuis sp. DW1]